MGAVAVKTSRTVAVIAKHPETWGKTLLLQPPKQHLPNLPTVLSSVSVYMVNRKKFIARFSASRTRAFWRVTAVKREHPAPQCASRLTHRLAQFIAVDLAPFSHIVPSSLIALSSHRVYVLEIFGLPRRNQNLSTTGTVTTLAPCLSTRYKFNISFFFFALCTRFHLFYLPVEQNKH